MAKKEKQKAIAHKTKYRKIKIEQDESHHWG